MLVLKEEPSIVPVKPMILMLILDLLRVILKLLDVPPLNVVLRHHHLEDCQWVMRTYARM